MSHPQNLLDLTYYRGRVALYAILKGLGIGQGDDVLTQAYTCVAVPEGILASGARPVYVDIEADGYTLDPEDLHARLTPRTRALVVQHTFGIPADMESIMRFAERQGLAVIEDCCHTVSSFHNGRRVGTFGAASFYSFEYGKPIAVGAGGSALANEPKLDARLREEYARFVEASRLSQWKLELQALAFRTLYSPRLYWTLKGAFHALSKLGLVTGNYHPVRPGDPSPEFGLRMGSLARRRLSRAVCAPASAASPERLYAAALRDLHVIQPSLREEDAVEYVRYPIRVSRKEAVARLAREQRVEVAEWYSTPVHPLSLDECRLVGYEPGSCPHAEQRAQEAVSLPLRGRISARYVEGVSSVLRRAA